MEENIQPPQEALKPEAPPQPNPSINNTPVTTTPKKKSPIIILLLVIALIGIGVAGYFGYQNYVLKNQITVTPPPPEPPIRPTDISNPMVLPTDKPTSSTDKNSYSENTSIPNQKKFVSPGLGISFLYLSQYGGEQFNTKEINNKVYVYPQLSDYSNGQYVEVFKKDPTKTLLETIKSTFLESYSPEKCIAYESAPSPHYPSNYVQANIKVPGEFSDPEEMSTKRQQCPTYTQSNGISYFLMDKNHPDKFVFFNIGQYSILANSEKELTWENTIQFLD